MAQAGVEISTVLDAYLVVTIFGVGTDYCLFIVSRFREELRQGDRARTIDTTMRRIGPVILASAVTVIVAFLCLSVSRFSMTRTNGWVLAVGIAVILAAGLTLVPALMSLFGRYLFWPMMGAPSRRERRFSWGRIGRWVSGHPLAIAVPIIVVLALPYLAFSNFRLSANLLSQLPPDVDSSRGLAVFREHFPVGELAPLHLVIQSREGNLLTPDSLRGIESVAVSMGGVEGIARADYFSAPSGEVTGLAAQVRGIADSFTGATGFDITRLAPLQAISGKLEALAMSRPEVLQSQSFTSAAGILKQLPDAINQLRGVPPAELPAALRQFQQTLYGLADALSSLGGEFRLEGSSPLVDSLKAAYFSIDGTITRIDLVLQTDPYADESAAAVKAARQAASAAIEASSLRGSAHYIGGDPAIRYDILRTSEIDFNRILLFASIGILLVIIVLLRSLLAPVYMVLTVLFNFGATLGITTWLFLDVLDVEYLVYLMPPLVFIMLAAVGADYNIFLVSRIREEAERYPIKTAVPNAVANTGGVITSCGIILAGTFATLGASSLPVMYEIGVPIAIGVLIDTFIVRALLVPSLATLTGRWSWWPSRLSRR
jgi:RND superfamily putative drug exporter